MLVNLYKSKTPVAVFSFPLFVGVLGLPIFRYDFDPVVPFFTWQTTLVDWVTETAVIHYIIAVSVVYLVGLEMNRLVNAYGFYGRNTYLPGIILALALSSLGQLHFSTILVAYGFLVYGLGFLFRINRQDPSLKGIFMAGLFFGVATVFEPVLMPVMVLPWFTLVIFRSFNWREWFMLLLGGGVPWLYHVGLHFAISGDIGISFERNPIFDLSMTFTPKWIGITTFLTVITVYAVWKYLIISNNQLLVFKKRSRVIFHFIWLMLISWALGWFFYTEHVLAVIIPFSIIVTVQMLNARSVLYPNFVVLLWIGLIGWTLFF